VDQNTPDVVQLLLGIQRPDGWHLRDLIEIDRPPDRQVRTHGLPPKRHR
jgi:hypothetical protein